MIGLTLNKLIFNEDTEIDLSTTDIVVFVGPNVSVRTLDLVEFG